MQHNFSNLSFLDDGADIFDNVSWGWGEPGTALRAYKTNPFFLSDCNRWALVNAQRVQRAIKRRPRGPINHRGWTAEWNCPILNMRECFLLTREKGRSQGWKDKLQIITWDIQHVKWTQQAPQAEKSPSSHVNSKMKRQTGAWADHKLWRTKGGGQIPCILTFYAFVSL